MMGKGVSRRGVVAVICAVLLITALVLIMAYFSAVSETDYNKGYEIGLEAYTYGLPLLVTNTTFETLTSINVSNGAFGPVNQFNNCTHLKQRGEHSNCGAGLYRALVDCMARSEQGARGPPCAGGSG